MLFVQLIKHLDKLQIMLHLNITSDFVFLYMITCDHTFLTINISKSLGPMLSKTKWNIILTYAGGRSIFTKYILSLAKSLIFLMKKESSTIGSIYHR